MEEILKKLEKLHDLCNELFCSKYECHKCPIDEPNCVQSTIRWQIKNIKTYKEKYAKKLGYEVNT